MKKFAFFLLLAVFVVALPLQAQAQPTGAVLLKDALVLFNYDVKGLKFDNPSDADFAVDKANYEHYVHFNFNGVEVYAFTHNKEKVVKLAKAEILLIMAGEQDPVVEAF